MWYIFSSRSERQAVKNRVISLLLKAKASTTWYHGIIFLALVTVAASALSLLVWACVQYAETSHGTPAQCAARLDGTQQRSDIGFVGSADFYGLGIRIGLYAQLLGLMALRRHIPVFAGLMGSVLEVRRVRRSEELRVRQSESNPIQQHAACVEPGCGLIGGNASPDDEVSGGGAGPSEAMDREAITAIHPLKRHQEDAAAFSSSQRETKGLKDTQSIQCGREPEDRPEQRISEGDRSITSAYAAFQIAIVVALLLLVFRSDLCTFTAEIIVIQYIVIAGTWLVLQNALLNSALLIELVTAAKGSSDKRVQKLKFQDLDGLSCVARMLNICLLPVSIWFWLRLASAGEKDFAQTPGGTSLFFLAAVRGRGLRVVGGIFATYMIWSFISSVADVLVVILGLLGVSRHMVAIMSTLFGISSYLSILNIPLMVVGAVMVLALKLGKELAENLVEERVPKLVPKLVQKVVKKLFYKVLDPDFFEENFKSFVNFWTKCMSCVVLLLVVLAIELTLYWNQISGVNTVDSTGQVIPMVIGLTVPVTAVWYSIQGHGKKNE